MHRTLALSVAILALTVAPALPQDAKDESPSWSGSLESTGVKQLPHPAKKDALLMGAFRTAEEWNAFWKAAGDEAPKVDFEKQIVVYALHQVQGGTCTLASPAVDAGKATVVVDTGRRAEKKAFRCHYPYSMRSIGRKDVKAVEFKEKGREKDDALCSLDPARPDDRKGVE